jgi:hypothetical protein
MLLTQLVSPCLFLPTHINVSLSAATSSHPPLTPRGTIPVQGRTSSAITTNGNNWGTDLAAEFVAAFAASAIVFAEEGDTSYANILLEHARELYDITVNLPPRKYDSIVRDAQQVYGSNRVEDELAWASIWLSNACGTIPTASFNPTGCTGLPPLTTSSGQPYVAEMLDAAKSYYTNSNLFSSHMWPQNYDSKTAGVALLLSRVDGDFHTDIEGYFQSWVNSKTSAGGWGPSSFTPQGLVYHSFPSNPNIYSHPTTS